MKQLIKIVINLIKTITLAIIFAFVLFAINLLVSSAFGLELKEVSIDYKNFKMVNDKARNPLIYPDHPKEGINLNMNTDIASYLYWNNTIESLTNEGQYASVGLMTTLGIRISQDVEFGYYHHSQHLLDRHHSYMDKFPSEDAINLKIYLFKDRRHESIL